MKTVVVMPAYNAEKTVRATYEDIPKNCVDDILLVDDCSLDRTVEVARQLGIKVIRHHKNLGYGANQKTCYNEALKIGADVVVMLHPDHQYSPKLIPDLIQPFKDGEADAIFGSRMLGEKFLEGGMPLWKFYANVFLSAITNIILKMFLTECHSGFRAYSRKYLEKVNYNANSNNFVFDTQIIIQGIHHKLRIREIPIETRYFEKASQISFWKSVQYGFSILYSLLRYKLHIWNIKHYAIL